MEFLSLKGDCTGLSESTLVRIPHCWKSHVAALVLRLIYKFWFQAGLEAEDLDNAEELDDENSNDDIVSLLEEAVELDDNNSNNHDDLPVVDSPAVGESGANNNSNLLSVKEPACSKKKVQTKPGSKVISNRYEPQHEISNNLTCVDSDEPVQPPFKHRNSKWCSVSSLTLIEYSRD